MVISYLLYAHMLDPFAGTLRREIAALMTVLSGVLVGRSTKCYNDAADRLIGLIPDATITSVTVDDDPQLQT